MALLKNNKPTLQDLYQFFKVVQRYSAANITMSESVRIFAEETKKNTLKVIMETLLRDLKNGMTFPAAISKHPTFFPAFIIGMMQVGESTGETKEILGEIVFHLEQEVDTAREIDSALWTPKIFLIGMFIAFLLGIFVVIPLIGELLTSANIELPLITQFVIGIGTVAQGFWWLFVCMGILAFMAYQYIKKEYPEKIDALKLKIPFFKTLKYNQIQYRFAKIFALCVQAGIGSTRALQYAAMATDNIVAKNTLKKAAVFAEKSGLQISDALKKANIHNIIAPSFYIMLRVGVSTSTIASVMLNESESYRKDMLISSKLLGEKVGTVVSIPGYSILIVLYASIEYPIMTMMQNLNILSGGM